MAFSSRKPDGWRCLFPVSSGPYTDFGSASTMGLVLKALGSGAPERHFDVTGVTLILKCPYTWRSHVLPIVKLGLSIDQGRGPVGSLIRISRGLEELDTLIIKRTLYTPDSIYLVASVLKTVDTLGLGQQECVGPEKSLFISSPDHESCHPHSLIYFITLTLILVAMFYQLIKWLDLNSNPIRDGQPHGYNSPSAITH